MRKSKSKEIQRKCPSNLNEFYQWVDAQNYSERDLLLIYEQPADTKTDEVCDLIEKAENICDYRVAAELRKKYNFLFEEKANKIVEDQNIQKHVNTFTSDPKHAEFMRFLCYAPNKKVETNLDFLTLYFNSQKRKNHFTSTFNVISEFEKQSVKDFSTDLFVKKYLQIRNRKKTKD